MKEPSSIPQLAEQLDQALEQNQLSAAANARLRRSLKDVYAPRRGLRGRSRGLWLWVPAAAALLPAIVWGAITVLRVMGVQLPGESSVKKEPHLLLEPPVRDGVNGGRADEAMEMGETTEAFAGSSTGFDTETASSTGDGSVSFAEELVLLQDEPVHGSRPAPLESPAKSLNSRRSAPLNREKLWASAMSPERIESALQEAQLMRVAGRPHDAFNLLKTLAKQPLSSRTQEIISYEQGVLLQEALSDERGACAHFARHLTRFRAGSYFRDVERRLSSLRCHTHESNLK